MILTLMGEMFVSLYAAEIKEKDFSSLFFYRSGQAMEKVVPAPRI